MTDIDKKDLNYSGEFTEEKKKSSSKLTDWENEPSVDDLRTDMRAAMPFHDTHTEKVRTWLDNLHVTGSAKPKNVKGKSAVQPKLIRQQAEWRYAALSEPFLSNEKLFSMSPVTSEDKQSATQNQLVLNSQFRSKINLTAFIDTYVRTSVDEGTAILRTGWTNEEEEVTESVETFTYNINNNPQAQDQMAQMTALYDSNPEEFSQAPPELLKSIELSKIAGVPMVPVSTGFEEVTKTVTTKNHPTVEVCDYDDVIIDPSCQGNIKDAQFIIYKFVTSKAILQAAGDLYSNLDDISVEQKSPLEMEDQAVNTEEGEAAANFTFKDEARKQFYAYEYWGYLDVDGDGNLTPIVATFVDDVMIRMEENPFPLGDLPFVVVPYLPVKNSVYGEPDGVLIEDNQKIVGAVTRGMIDIMARGANGQVGSRKDALDIINRRKFQRGEDYEFNAQVDPTQAFHMHTYDQIPQSASYMLDMNKAEAAEMTGVRAFGATDPGVGSNTATADRSALDAASKRETGILRRLAAGIEEVGRKFMAMNAEFLDEEEIVRITNDEFVPVRRDDLEGKVDLELSITTAEEDNQKAQELSFMAQTTTSVMGPAFAQKILSNIATLRKMPALAKEIEEYQPEPDPLAQRIQELEIAKLEAEIEEIKSKTAENYAEANLDNAKAGNTQSDTDNKNLDYLSKETGIDHSRDVEKITSQAESQGKLKLLDSQLKAQQEAQGTPES